MKISNIVGRDIPESWWLSLHACLKEGKNYVVDRGSFEGTVRRELDFLALHILHPSTRPLIPSVPEGAPAPTDDNYIQDYLPYLLTSLVQDNEEYTYGQWIEQQLEEVIKMLRISPQTNQAVIAVGDENSIWLESPPCLRQIQFKVRESKLDMTVYFRSWDLYSGMPSNLAALQLMKEMVADEVGVEDGEIVAVSMGAHLYQHSIVPARRVCGFD